MQDKDDGKVYSEIEKAEEGERWAKYNAEKLKKELEHIKTVFGVCIILFIFFFMPGACTTMYGG